jgi:surface polysaccharide O-acyltransferase-like enzyme
MNYLAVFVAGVLNVLFGLLWFSPALFGKRWMKLAGVKDMTPHPSTMALYLLASLMISFTLSILIALTNADTVLYGAAVGMAMAFGFIATTSMGIILWESKPMDLYILNAAFYVLSLGLMGAVLAGMP